MLTRAMFALGAAAAALAACHAAAHRPEAERRLDPRLVAVGRQAPDSMVGVLVRLAAPPAVSERDALRRAGLSLGTVAGDVVTGRIRAADAPGLAKLSFVIYAELARQIPVSRPPAAPPSRHGRNR